MLSVPIQQIGRVYMEVGPIAFSEEDRKLVWEVGAPEVWFKYAAKCSDTIVDGYRGTHGKVAAESSYFAVGVMDPGHVETSKYRG